MGGRGFFCAVVGCTSAVWVACRQLPESGAEAERQLLPQLQLQPCVGRPRDSRRGCEAEAGRPDAAGAEMQGMISRIEDRVSMSCGRRGQGGKGPAPCMAAGGGPSSQVVRTLRGGRQGPRVLRTPRAERSNPRILHGRGRKVEECRREDAELRGGRGGFLPAVTCGRSCAPGLPRRSRDRGSAGRDPSRPSP